MIVKMSKSKLPSLPKTKERREAFNFPTAVDNEDLLSDETKTAFYDYLNFGMYPSNEESETVLNLLKDKQSEFAMQGNYLQSSKCSTLIRELKERIENIRDEEELEQRKEYLNERIREQEENIQKIEEKWGREVNDFIYEHEERMMKDDQRRQLDIDLYCDKFENVDNLRQFAKPSTTLLDVKARERILLLANRFKEALTQAKLGNVMQEEETEEKQKIAEKEVQRMVDKFANDRLEMGKISDQRALTKIHEMQQKQKDELDKANARLNKLKIDLENCKLSNFKHKQSSRKMNERGDATQRSCGNRPSTTLLLRKETFSSKLKFPPKENRKGKSQNNYRATGRSQYKAKTLGRKDKLNLLPAFE